MREAGLRVGWGRRFRRWNELAGKAARAPGKAAYRWRFYTGTTAVTE